MLIARKEKRIDKCVFSVSEKGEKETTRERESDRERVSEREREAAP